MALIVFTRTWLNILRSVKIEMCHQTTTTTKRDIVIIIITKKTLPFYTKYFLTIINFIRIYMFKKINTELLVYFNAIIFIMTKI